MIYGPIYSAVGYAPNAMLRWLDENLTQGIDYNWELSGPRTGVWELFFYNNPENITAFKLKFGV
jgi:hypothetical protein